MQALKDRLSRWDLVPEDTEGDGICARPISFYPNTNCRLDSREHGYNPRLYFAQI